MGSVSQLQLYGTTFGNKDPWHVRASAFLLLKLEHFVTCNIHCNTQSVEITVHELYFQFFTHTHTSQNSINFDICLRWYMHESGGIISINKIPVRRQRNSYWPHYLENFLTTRRCQDGCRTDWNSWKLLFNKFASHVLDKSIQNKEPYPGQIKLENDFVGFSSGFCSYFM